MRAVVVGARKGERGRVWRCGAGFVDGFAIHVSLAVRAIVRRSLVLALVAGHG